MKTKNVTEKNMKVCLVGSSGGHLTHLYPAVPEYHNAAAEIVSKLLTLTE